MPPSAYEGPPEELAELPRIGDIMSRNVHARLAFFAIIAAIGSLNHGVLAQDAIGVNGPISLPASVAPLPSADGSKAEPIEKPIVLDSSPLAALKSIEALRGENQGLSENSKAPAKSASETRRLGHPISLAKPNNAAAPERGVSFTHINFAQGEVGKVIGALAIVIGVLLIVRACCKRFVRGDRLVSTNGRPSGVLEILARYPVARGQHLILLKLARRIVLLHHSGSTMTALSEITSPNEVAALLTRMEAGANDRTSAKFRNTLDEFLADHDMAPLPSNTIPDVSKTRRLSANLRSASLTPRTLPHEAEIVDLTRRSKGLLLGLLGKAAR